MLTVSDTGIGISEAALGKYSRLSSRTASGGLQRDGLGIGLTVVRELVEAHGGSVVASSDGTGLGSQFTIRLPRLSEAA